DGVTESTLPTGTPSTRTSLPSYSDTVRGKSAVSVFWWPPPNTNATSAVTASASTTTGTRIFVRRLISATHLRNGRDVLDVGVEPRPTAEGVGEDPVERPQQPDDLVEVVGVRSET